MNNFHFDTKPSCVRTIARPKAKRDTSSLDDTQNVNVHTLCIFKMLTPLKGTCISITWEPTWRAETRRHILCIYRVSQEEYARLREGVPYVKVYRYNLKHLCPKLNGYGDNGQRKGWSSGRSTHCTCQLTTLSMPVLECGFILRQFSSCSQ